MHSRLRFAMFCTFLLFGPPSLAQQTIQSPNVSPGSALPEQNTGLQRIPLVVRDQPYSATTETELSRTLSDGTHINRKMAETKMYRDSAGRTRTERYMPAWVANASSNGNPPVPISVFIRDPVAGVSYMLNPRDHTARQGRVFIPKDDGTNQTGGTVVQVGPRTPPSRPDRPRPKVKVQDLGTQVMDGLDVVGQKITTTVPVNFEGNDQPFDIVTERWFSPELETYILIKRFDPLSGENTMKTTILNRTEQDITLFQVPPDYTITQQ
jgi:hypothetical protein